MGRCYLRIVNLVLGRGGREEAVLDRNELSRLRKRPLGLVNPGQVLPHKRSLTRCNLFCVRRPRVRPFSMFVVAIYQFVGLIDIGSGRRLPVVRAH